jgi:hypothetical protein
VATDQTSRLTVEEPTPTPPAIENELPTYRAISTRAVFSALCGIMASFSFASLYFLAFAVLAIVLGILANVAIKRYPDMLTGRRLANAGIAMGLVFGLVASTYTGAQAFILKREATRFGREYADLFQNGSLGEILWLNLHPEMRKSKSAAQVQSEFESAKNKERMMVDQKTAPTRSLRKRLSSAKDQKFHFVDIESQGVDESQPRSIAYFASALFEVEGPATKDFPEPKQYALAIFKGIPKGRHYEWWVENVVFPYQPRSYQGPTKPVSDDGHGHPH